MVQSAVVRSNEKGLRVLVSVGMRQGTLPNTHCVVRSVGMRQGTLLNTAWFVLVNSRTPTIRGVSQKAKIQELKPIKSSITLARKSA